MFLKSLANLQGLLLPLPPPPSSRSGPSSTLNVRPVPGDIFAGAANDLKGFCGKRIVADGLMINDPEMPLFALQFKRPAPDGKWSRANWFIKDWAQANGVAPDSPKAKQWFRNDPDVQRLIEQGGVFGLGPDADKAYFETNALWYNPTPLEQPYYNWMTAAAFARDDLEMTHLSKLLATPSFDYKMALRNFKIL